MPRLDGDYDKDGLPDPRADALLRAGRRPHRAADYHLQPADTGLGDGLTISDSLAGRRALVTGGSKGQGAGIVARLREAGALVMTTARTQPENDPHPDLFITADVAPAAGAQIVLDGVRARLGAVDILVHVVGGSHAPFGGFATLSDEHWQEELSLNLLSAVRLDRGLLPAMIAARA